MLGINENTIEQSAIATLQGLGWTTPTAKRFWQV